MRKNRGGLEARAANAGVSFLTPDLLSFAVNLFQPCCNQWQMGGRMAALELKFQAKWAFEMLSMISYTAPRAGPFPVSRGTSGFMLERTEVSAASEVDSALIGRIAAGDQLALRSLYARHHLRIHRFLARTLRDTGAVEDVLAEVFLDVWRQAGRFEGRSSVNTWLCAMARNKALAHLRKYPPPVQTGAIDEPADAADTPEIAAQKTDKGAKLKHCVDSLGPEHRAVIDLIYYHEKSVEEVGMILDIPVATVKTRMFYARKKLSGLLAQAGIDRGWP